SGAWGTDTLLDLMCAAARTPVPGVRAVVEGRGEYTTGRGPTPFRWSLTAGPAEPATVAAFCNTVRTPGGGSHLTAAVKGLSEALADRASRIRDLGLAKGEDGPEAQDFAAVTALAVDTRAPDVAWDSQAKTAVSSRSLNVAMALDVARSVTIWAANPGNADTVSLWTKLALEAARARRSAEGEGHHIPEGSRYGGPRHSDHVAGARHPVHDGAPDPRAGYHRRHRQHPARLSHRSVPDPGAGHQRQDAVHRAVDGRRRHVRNGRRRFGAQTRQAAGRGKSPALGFARRVPRVSRKSGRPGHQDRQQAGHGPGHDVGCGRRQAAGQQQEPVPQDR